MEGEGKGQEKQENEREERREMRMWVVEDEQRKHHIQRRKNEVLKIIEVSFR